MVKPWSYDREGDATLLFLSKISIYLKWFHAPNSDRSLTSLVRSIRCVKRALISTTYGLCVVLRKIYDSIGLIMEHPYYKSHSYKIEQSSYHIAQS